MSRAPSCRSRAALLPPLAAGALLAFVAAGTLAGCSSSASGPTAAQAVTTSAGVVVHGAAGIAGVSVDISLASGFTVLDVTPAGALAGASCQANIETGRVRDSCALSGTTFGGTATVFTLTVRHPDTQTVVEGLSPLTCSAADSTGSAIAITCEVIAL